MKAPLIAMSAAIGFISLPISAQMSDERQAEIQQAITSCENGDFNECLNLGQAALRAGSSPAAVHFFELACDKASDDDQFSAGRICGDVAEAIEAGQEGFERDIAVSTRLFAKACLATVDGQDYYCPKAGDRYAEGTVVAGDPELAKKVLSSLCVVDLSGSTCSQFTEMLLSGRGVPKDVAQGVERLESDCIRNDNPISCKRAAGIYGDGVLISPRPSKAEGLYRWACRLRDAEGCELLAAAISASPAEPAPAETQDATANRHPER